MKEESSSVNRADELRVAQDDSQWELSMGEKMEVDTGRKRKQKSDRPGPKSRKKERMNNAKCPAWAFLVHSRCLVDV